MTRLQPLSPEWWALFHSRTPFRRDTGSGKADSCFPDKESIETLQPYFLSQQVVLVIGGKPASGAFAYVSPDEVARFLGSSAKDENEYNKRIDIGHIVEYFLEAQYNYGGAIVYHASAIDQQEVSKESRSKANRTGLCETVSKSDLLQRAEWLFDEEKQCHAADVIGLFPGKAAARVWNVLLTMLHY